MPGLTDWWDVFRCGTHIDHSGTKRTITAADIDHAISVYEPGSSPLVVGHPQLNAPAYGWVSEWRRLGDLVQARATQVAPEFAEAVRAGRWKKRSIAFGPDMTFRHVGFLGAAAPAIKGLRDIVFADKEAFMEIETVPASEAETSSPNNEATVHDKPEAELPQPDNGDKLSEIERELADVKAKLGFAIKAYETEHNKNLKAEFAAYADDLVSKGCLKRDAKGTLVEYMFEVNARQGAEFAESDNSDINRFKTLLNAILQPRVEFAEVATQSAVSPIVSTGNAQAMAKIIRSYREDQKAKNNPISASQAMQYISGGNHA